MSKVTIGLSSSQKTFLMEKAPYTLFNGGLGSGKTFGGAVWTAIMSQQYPDCNGFITANSYSQLNKATLSTFFEVLELLGLEYRYLKNQKEIHIDGNKGIIYVASMENPDDLRGVEVGYAWSDECAFYKQMAFDVLIGRIRDPKGPCQWKGTTTPNGFNWLYDKFVQDPLPGAKVIRSKTTDNLANLASSYYETLTSQYDSKLAQQELDGEFVNLTGGKVFYTFDRRIHCREIEVDKYETIFVGLDFNVHPLCGVFCVQRADKIYIIDELFLEDSNTFEAAKEIIRRYRGRELRIVPDETGNRRKTSAARTDHEILRRSNLRLVNFKNPPVKDRVNNLNRLFEQGRVYVSPKCKMLIKDLSLQPIKAA